MHGSKLMQETAMLTNKTADSGTEFQKYIRQRKSSLIGSRSHTLVFDCR